MADDNDDDTILSSLKRGGTKWMDKPPTWSTPASAVFGPVKRAATAAYERIIPTPGPGGDNSNFPAKDSD
jgi:hypothetical protein